MTKIIFIRHGETYWNLELKYQGHTDIELTPKGIEQAKKVAARLAGEKIDAVYASDLRRAFKTAEYIADVHQLPVIAVPKLREINFGDWEGLMYDSICDQWPDVMDKFYTLTDEVQIPGGETFRELKQRAEEAVAEIVKNHPDQTVVVVTHGGTIRTIICAALNIHLNYLWNIRQDNTAVNIINYFGDRTIVDLINSTYHLK